MARTVYIFGAGASADDGAPVMSNFLDTADDLRRGGMVHEHEPDFDRVFEAIDELQGVFAKSFIDTRNIESVFTALEMAKVIGRIRDPKTDAEFDQLIRSLVLMIARTLERKTVLAQTSHQNRMPYYQAFVTSLKNGELKDSAVITFNYDCGLDYAFRVAQVNVDYWLPIPPSATRNPFAFDLLKLHGSINWFQKDGEDIQVVTNQAAANFMTSDGTASYLTAAGGDARTRGASPVIVPPSQSKGHYHDRLSTVWKRAVHHLQEAENIVVVGYSLPVTDEFFRNLFALGTMSKARLRRVFVFNRYADRQLRTRYEKLLGRLSLPTLKMFKMSFRDMAAAIGSAETLLQLDGEPRSDEITAD